MGGPPTKKLEAHPEEEEDGGYASFRTVKSGTQEISSSVIDTDGS